ncbi:hypothetical protein GF366_01935 [Candidatus Peregrinibacteria bacterium]|nr:hypothetical protein [Candidatus Peregrinibacteria bacterium]
MIKRLYRYENHQSYVIFIPVQAERILMEESSVCRKVDQLEESERAVYQSISWQILIYVAAGLVVALMFDELGFIGYLPEGIVRALAGTADTLGLMVAGLISLLRGKEVKAPTWIIGGLVGLAAAFLLQAMVYQTPNPHGPWGVIYASAFSNFDNAFAGVLVLVFALQNHGFKEGWRRYWRHPFYVGNAIMLAFIPLVDLIVRSFAGFRPDINFSSGLEAGAMDLDSVGAALVFIVATRRGVRVPRIDDRIWRRRRRPPG